LIVILFFRDQEEEERRKKIIKDNKLTMRNFLMNQMGEKKQMSEIEKKIESEQLKLWSDDNEKYFRKEKETNERVRRNKILIVYLFYPYR
jgi:hypothetical protein